MTHATTALHQLHLLLVNLHDSAIGVAGAVVANNKTIGKRDHLEVIADARHGTALRNDVFKILQELIDRLLRHWVGVVLLDAGKLGSETVVHHVGVQFIDLVVLAKCVLVHPHIGGKFVATKVCDGRFHNLLRLVLGILLRLKMLIIITKI